jgi:quinol monooxygenase YgiN
MLMVIVIIKMKALPEKCLELKQTLLALIEPTRKEKNCLSHNVFQDLENDNGFSLIQVWQSREDLDDHLRSDRFTVLMGTRSLLSRPLEITMSEISHPAGWEAVEAARS